MLKLEKETLNMSSAFTNRSTEAKDYCTDKVKSRNGFSSDQSVKIESIFIEILGIEEGRVRVRVRVRAEHRKSQFKCRKRIWLTSSLGCTMAPISDPSGKTIVPKSANEVKLINSGQILENNKTVGQCKVLFGEIAGNIIIMHVVVQPSLAKTKAEKKVDDSPKKPVCSCSIL
ncbi:hypothetical protein DEO72_LG2g5344 [Vigna unguiculata]|uniref:UBL3-like ubiquitin domain-containing protein n=1 Tax=Vigna unguiculata TaxID=3917 RepID=A0A4D6L954_VIGUN|nr:hypothetical protein DEO72_LG2g5344 [Vigna unguiculata]